MPDGLRADGRPGQLERTHRGLARGALPGPGPRQPRLQRLPAAEQARSGHPYVVEEDVGGVRGPQAELAQLLGADQPRRARRHDERGLAARAQLRVDRRGHHVHVGDAAVGRVRLLSIEDPLVGGLVVAGPGPHGADVGAGLRLGRAERGDLRVGGVAEALWHPLDQLLRRARAVDRGDGQATCP